VGVQETFLDVEDGLEVLLAGLDPLVLEGLMGGRELLGSLGLGGQELLAAQGLGVGVELDQGTEVPEWVLLVGGTASPLGAGGPDGVLDLVRVDDALEVSVVEEGLGEEETLLGIGTLGGGAEEGVEGLEGRLGPDDKAAEVTSGGQGKEVKGADAGELNTGNVPEGPGDTLVLVVNDEGAEPVSKTAVPELSLTSPELLGPLGLLHITEGLDALKDGDGLLGLGDALGSVVDDEGDLSNPLDAVAAGLDEGGEGGGGNSRHHGEAALVLVHLPVPPAPGLGGGEHATLTAHVSEGSLSGTVGSSTGDTGNTGDGTTGTPGLSAVLVASSLGDGVSLAPVLGHVGVDKLDNVGADRGLENPGDAHRPNSLALLNGLDLNESSGGLQSTLNFF